MKKAILNIITIVCCALIAWAAWSFVDVVKDNSLPGAQHSEANLFMLID